MKGKLPKTNCKKDWQELSAILCRLCWKEIVLGFIVIVLCIVLGLRLGLRRRSSKPGYIIEFQMGKRV